MSEALGTLRAWYGIARSAAIYHGNPAKLRRARRFYRDFVRANGLCFDIGAHLGDRTCHFLALGARVVAVEPQPRLARLLRRAFARDPRVTIVEAAVGAAPGRAVLTLPSANPTVASIVPDWIAAVGRAPRWRGTRWDSEIEVAVTTLAELVAAHGTPDFCKLDIEGAEAAALTGLDRPLPALSFEYVTASIDGTLTALDRLAALGRYACNYAPGETMRLALPDWIGADEMRRLARRLPAGSGDIYARLIPSSQGGQGVAPDAAAV